MNTEKWKYQDILIKDFMSKTGLSFENKKILEIGSDFDLNVARYFIELGAKEVVCVNPKFPKELVSDVPQIKLIKSLGEQTKLPSHSFDIIFGVALLEHVLHLSDLVSEIKRLLKLCGVAYLQGSPIYPSRNGHHLWVKLPNIHYHFSKETNPFENWEHLCLKSAEEISNCLRGKNIPEEHIPHLVEYLISDDTSKLPASEIIRLIKGVKGVNTQIYTRLDKTPANKFYDLAKKQYTEDDLRISDLRVIITHKFFDIFSRMKIKNFIKKCKDFLFCVKIYFY